MKNSNDAYISRNAESRLERMLSGKKVGIVLGARQVGKTTIVEHVAKSRRTRNLNFDIETDKLQFMACAKLPPPNVAQSLNNPELLILDEAQRLPEAARIVKGWHDAKVPFRIVLLGSSSLELLAHTTESLTGRNTKLRLPPLLFEETIKIQEWALAGLPRDQILKDFAEPMRAFLMQRLAYGSYPEVVTSDDREELLRELAADYLWKDILQTGLVKTPGSIKQLLMLLAHQVGSEVSTNELATQLGIARATVDRYMDLLEQCFVIFRLPAFSTNPRKEISKSKKVYFWDTGIRNAVLNAFDTSDLRPDIGALWENWCIAEIAKRNMLLNAPWDLFFWRSRTASEVDLVMKQSEILHAFEIKWRRRRVANRAFRDAYSVSPELLCALDPFLRAANRLFTP